MTAQSWIEEEPGWAELREHLGCVRRRARKHWVKTLLLTLMLTALVAAYRARKQRLYEASVVIRVVEGEFDPTTAPPTSSQLTEYLNDVALARHVLLGVMEEHELYQRERGIDPNLALEVMREDIDLAVVRNYFSQQRFSEDPARSAQIVISYAGRDPEGALLVARRLGTLVAEEQVQGRREVSEAAAASASDTVAGLTRRLDQARAEQSALQLRIGAALPGRASREIVKLRSVTANIRDLEAELKQAEADQSSFEMRGQVEDSALGMRFELIDPGRTPRVILTKTQQLAVLAFLAFVFLLPVVGVGVGAFDPRIYDQKDLRRLGLEPYGHIPAFPGCRVGSYQARVKEAKRNAL